MNADSKESALILSRRWCWSVLVAVALVVFHGLLVWLLYLGPISEVRSSVIQSARDIASAVRAGEDAVAEQSVLRINLAFLGAVESGWESAKWWWFASAALSTGIALAFGFPRLVGRSITAVGRATRSARSWFLMNWRGG